MANKIGIEVGVEFPTVGELQAQLAQKWAKVKNGFEGKINIDIDGNSLKSAKAKIKTALKEDAFNIKLDTSNAIKAVAQIQNHVKELDNQLKKTREIKIDFKVSDLDKSMKQILENAKTAGKGSADAQEEAKKKIEAQNKAFREQIGLVSKVAEISRQTRDPVTGKVDKESTRIKTTQDSGSGSSTVKSHDLKTGITTVEDISNREKALKELEGVARRIHQIEMEQVNAQGKHFQILERERGIQKEQLEILSDQYKQKYKFGALDLQHGSMGELKRQQEVALEAKMLLAIKQQEKQANNEIAQAVSKVAQLEAKKNSLAVQMINATEKEKASLQELYGHYEKAQNKIKEKHNLQEKMNSAQKDEMDNLRTIGMLQVQQAEAKKQALSDAKRLTEEERKAKQEQKEALAVMKADLQDVHRLKMKIAELDTRKNMGSLGVAENSQLQALREQLVLAERNQQANRQMFESVQLITREMQKQLGEASKINQQEMERSQITAKHRAEQDAVTAKLKEYEAVVRNINQLSRDLAFAGTRERAEIERALASERAKENAIKSSLSAQNSLVQERMREVHAIEQAQSAQQRLNRLRSEAREKDRMSNEAHGAVDFYSTYANFEQAIRAIIEPMKELDEAFIGVSKVAQASEDDLNRFKETAFDVGSTLGVTASDYMKAVETWVTSGETFMEAQKKAKVSLIGSFVGNLKPDDMVKYMSVPLNAFKKQGLETNDVINVMNETANNHAIEMDDLGKAYVRSANTAKDTGIDFGYLTGMITGAQEATRKGGERIGTGIKTIAMNMTNITSQLTPDTQKKFAWFKQIGVDFKDSNGQMREGDAILGDLVKKWDTLSQEQKGTAKFYLAGKEHAEILGGIIDQWERVEQVAGETNQQLGLGENGSAYLEHAKQASSLKFKMVELKNAWMELMNNIGNSAGLAGLVDVVTVALQKLADVATNEKFMEALKFTAFAVGIHAMSNGMRQLTDTMKTGASGIMRDLSQVGSYFGTLTGKIGEATRATRLFNKEARVSNVSTVDINNGGSRNVNSGGRNNNSNNNADSNRNNNSTRNAVQSASNAGAVLEGTSSKISAVGKGIGKLLGMIPLVGDALLLLDFVGVPVFDNMGKAYDNLFKSAEKQALEYEQSVKKFESTNFIVNGMIEKTQANLDKLQEKIDKSKQTDKDPNQEGTQAWMEQDEFMKIKDEIEKQGQDLGVDIKVTVNSYEEVQAKLDELKKKKDELAEKSTVEIASQMTGDWEKLKESQQTIAELKGEQEVVKGKMDEINTAMGKLGTSPEDDQKRKMWQATLKTLQGEYDGLGKKINSAGKEYETAQHSINASAEALLKQGKNMKASNLTAEQATAVYPAMISQYRNMRDSSDKLANIQKKVAEGHKLSADEVEALGGELKQYAGIAPEKIAADKNLQKEIQNNIDAKIKEKGTTIKTAEEALIAIGQHINKEQEVQKEIDRSGKQAKDTEKDIGILNGEYKKIPAEVVTNVVAKGLDWVIEQAKSAKSWLDKVAGSGTGAKVDASVSATPEQGKSSSVASNVSSSRSSSISANGVPVKGVGRSVSGVSKYNSDRDYNSANENATVSESVWRYWGQEMYRGASIEKELKNLTIAINEAKDDQSKLIPLYKQQQALLKKQVSHNEILSYYKDKELDEVLNKLSDYGFWVDTDTNNINNLYHAKDLKGESAQKAEELLNRWKSLYTEIGGLQDTIANLNSNVKGLDDTIEKAKITEELKKLEPTMKRVDAILTKVTNSDAITSRKLGFVGSQDKELALHLNARALNESKQNMSELINEFNRLSTMSVQFKENGSQIQSQLQKVSSAILAQADAVIKYRQAMNDIEISRITEDMNKFNSAIDENNTKIDNVVKNLQDGLLSRTGVGDLYSSNITELDLSRDNRLQQMAIERINLEKEVQEALEGYAKKNVERTEWVANSILDINKQMYNQLLGLEYAYKNGQDLSMSRVSSSVLGDMGDINKIDAGYGTFVAGQLTKYIKEVQKEQSALLKEYEHNLASTLNPDEKDSLTNKYIIDSMKLQEKYLRANIQGNNEAIEELNRQLQDTSLTDDQVEKIKQQISTYEKDNVGAQNSIKDSIKKRFEFEFSLLSKAVKEYDKASASLDYLTSIVNLLDKNNTTTKGTILGEQLNVERSKNAEIKKSLNYLNQQLGLYEKGSFEWNLINAQVEQYNKQLNDSNKELLQINKNIMDNSFNNITNKMEKELFGGKTQKAWKQHQELWIEGLEREIALEKMYKRMADLGTSINEDKLALLDKQEKLSKFEMDYLNKQLDIVELQNKINNLNQEKKIQTLKQNEFGQWDWVYEADQKELDKAKEDLEKAKLEFQKMEEKAREDYLSQLDKILANAKDGDYDSVKDFEDAIKALGVAFESILGDFPQIQSDYVKELVSVYSKYIKGNKDVMSKLPVEDIMKPISTNFNKEIKETFTEISSELGKVFADALLSRLPNMFNAQAVSRSVASSPTQITIDNIEFPNVTTPNGIKEAILNLPQVALQRSKSKL
ncbi:MULTISPECIES: phage tail tape measure protein [Bacillus cereus group]|uniref:phage tail tape measure protein n=3 Tax=Bacillus TaxID=1386 RepID=UPI000BF6CA8D|nr:MULTISPECIES: phage tail tape measure protein [Bacillus cereus group]PGA25355.1 phage tail tape measure protein [Bacillus thuringiensis]PGU82132.1 phage tail tape measure protein [Bacillus cereus]